MIKHILYAVVFAIFSIVFLYSPALLFIGAFMVEMKALSYVMLILATLWAIFILILSIMVAVQMYYDEKDIEMTQKEAEETK